MIALTSTPSRGRNSFWYTVALNGTSDTPIAAGDSAKARGADPSRDRTALYVAFALAIRTLYAVRRAAVAVAWGRARDRTEIPRPSACAMRPMASTNAPSPDLATPAHHCSPRNSARIG